MASQAEKDLIAKYLRSIKSQESAKQTIQRGTSELERAIEDQAEAGQALNKCSAEGVRRYLTEDGTLVVVDDKTISVHLVEKCK